MANDPTESERRRLISERGEAMWREAAAAKIEPTDPRLAQFVKDKLAEAHGEVLTTEEMLDQYEPIQFAAPVVVVRRRSDGQMGSLFFFPAPRYYYGWQAHEE